MKIESLAECNDVENVLAALKMSKMPEMSGDTMLSISESTQRIYVAYKAARVLFPKAPLEVPKKKGKK